MHSDEGSTAGEGRLQRLSEAHDWEISDGYPDIRGWDVIDDAGNRIGRVDDLLVDTEAERVRAIEVAREGSTGETRFPITPARIDEREHRVIVSGAGFAMGGVRTEREEAGPSSLRGEESRAGRERAGEEAHMVRQEEELDVEKRRREAGEVSIRKRIETEHVSRTIPRTHEEVTVERRPVTGDRSAAGKLEEEEVRVPITEEEIVVEKRPVVKEEIVVKTKPVTEEETVETDLRKERVEVDRERPEDRDRRP